MSITQSVHSVNVVRGRSPPPTPKQFRQKGNTDGREKDIYDSKSGDLKEPRGVAPKDLAGC